MSSAEIANLLLALVAIVAVLSALGGIACVFWVTRARKNLPDHTPPVTHLQAAQGARRRARAEPAQLFPARLSRAIQLLFCVADDDDPAIEVVRKLMSEFPDQDCAARRRLPGLRAQSQGREPGGDGPSSQARRDPDQRFQRAGSAVLSARDRLLSGRAGRRAGDRTSSPAWAKCTPARSWKTCS